MIRPTTRVMISMALALLLLGALALVSRSATPAAESVEETGGETSPVCFWSAQGPACVERLAGMGRAAELDAEGLLITLLGGPTDAEQAQGLWSAIPGGTTLEELKVQLNDTITVHLRMSADALQTLDHETFEVIVEQVGWTLEPLAWRHLRIQVWDPVTGKFVPLSAFLPEIPAPRKETLLTEGESGIARVHTGQPPASGQGQPQGALSGKTVYVSAGHGWQWTGSQWRTQRPVYQEFIEDHNNAEVVNQYLLQYLWNAGAQVWPVRERSMITAEVIIDNDNPVTDTGYFETGVWTTTTNVGTGYAGSDYRWTETVTGAPTAAAVWTATLPTAGEYAVYVWYRPGSDRTSEARYTVHHAGGETPVVVDQRYHGITWRHVGDYGFRGGEVATVTLSNLSSQAGKRVIADAVRFGGGVFDDLSGIGTTATYAPDKPWWEVATFYYAQRMGMSQPPGDVTARPIYARWEHAGSGDDAVYVSWHTNGYDGSARGTETYAHSGEWLPRTQGSLTLCHTIHTQVVHDIRAGWDPFWTDRGEKTKNLGELRLLWDEDASTRMPGALVEIGFHDNPDDAAALKEPAFQLLAARAVYQGILHYFDPNGVELPEPPTHLAVQNAGGGQVRLSWQPSPTDTVGLVGDAATGYRVYTSTAGLGWSNGVSVTGATAYTITGLPDDQLIFVRVSATNDGGESFPTEVLAARVGDDAGVLVVNGFDRLNSTMLISEDDPVEGSNLRMLLNQMNRYDYAIQHGEAITYPFDSGSNEAVQVGVVSLDDYGVVDWILGEESAQDDTLDGTEQALLSNFLDGGGALFINGTEIGWDLDYLGSSYDRAFYTTTLRAEYGGDDAGTYEVAPVSGSILDGLASFRFDAPGMYDADYPDQMTPTSGSTPTLTYSGGQGGAAAIQYQSEAATCPRLVYFGFPFETIHSDQRAAVMARVMGFLAPCLPQSLSTKISAPAHLSAHNVPPPFAGTAKATGTDIQRVEVQIQRASDSYYRAESAWVTPTTWLTATGTGVWSYTLPTLDNDGDYYLRARAWTTDSISDTSPAEVVFTYDTTPPTSTTLITPTGGITFPAVTGVTLLWEAAPADGGSSLAYVLELDGGFYTTTQAVYTTGHVTEGLHTWGVQVFDGAGNYSAWVTDTFAVTQHRIHLPLVAHNFSPEDGGGGGPCSDAVVNGGFETEDGWVLNQAAYDTTQAHSDAQSARVGVLWPGQVSYSSVAQTMALPEGSAAALRLWTYPSGSDSDDTHYVVLYDQLGQRHDLDFWLDNAPPWKERVYDLSAYLGQNVTLYIGTRNDGYNDTATMYVDDVVLEICP